MSSNSLSSNNYDDSNGNTHTTFNFNQQTSILPKLEPDFKLKTEIFTSENLIKEEKAVVRKKLNGLFCRISKTFANASEIKPKEKLTMNS